MCEPSGACSRAVETAALAEAMQSFQSVSDGTVLQM